MQIKIWISYKNKVFKFSLITPINLSYWWNLGSLLGSIIIIQILSGLLLTFYYENSSNSFYSLCIIHIEVFWGSFVHFTHMNFASFIFMILYFHIIKAFLCHSFSNLKLVWVTGWIILFIIIIIAFLGYVLPWGQISLWGATVITNLLRALPYGLILVKWIWGGYFVSNFTIKLFFSLHFLIPLLLILLIIIHIIVLHYYGSSNPLGRRSNILKVEFLPVFIIKDILNIIIIFIIFIFLILIPYSIGDPENFNTANSLVSPIHIQPEWYFLQYYAILRAIPRKLGGVILFVLSLVFLLLLVLTNIKLNYSKVLIGYIRIFININIILIWLGGSPVEDPYLIISQGFSFLYFFWFIFIFKNFKL